MPRWFCIRIISIQISPSLEITAPIIMLCTARVINTKIISSKLGSPHTLDAFYSSFCCCLLERCDSNPTLLLCHLSSKLRSIYGKMNQPEYKGSSNCPRPDPAFKMLLHVNASPLIIHILCIKQGGEWTCALSTSYFWVYIFNFFLLQHKSLTHNEKFLSTLLINLLI